MEGNPYNLIAFPYEEYEEIVIPQDQQLTVPSLGERTGFTVVEWGGTQLG